MTQAEIIERIGFGCGGDAAETLFRAGFRAVRPSPFDDGEGTPIRDFVSWTGLDATSTREGEAVARGWRLRAVREDGAHASARAIFGTTRANAEFAGAQGSA